MKDDCNCDACRYDLAPGEKLDRWWLPEPDYTEEA